MLINATHSIPKRTLYCNNKISDVVVTDKPCISTQPKVVRLLTQ